MKIIINIYNNLNGSITHYLFREWSINIYAVERFVLESEMTDEQKTVLSKPGVYILVNEECVYIGQSQNIIERWKQHIRNEEKDWFNCAYAITDLRDFSATDLNALEYLFLKKVQEAERFEIMNATVAENQKKDYLKDSNFYNSVFKNVNLLLNSIYRGHRVFDRIDLENIIQAENSIAKEEGSLNDELQNKIFTMKNSECYGQLKKVKEGWLLLKGAQTRTRDFENSVKNENAKKVIKYSIAYLDGKLDTNLKTTEDVLFSSPSTAATALLQQNANGWKEWKDEKGNALDEYR